jgi:hypothetical protein
MNRFEEYKNELENCLIEVSYLYSADINSSSQKTKSFKTSYPEFSYEMVNTAIDEIYKESIGSAIEKSVSEVNISRDMIKSFDDVICRLPFSPKYFIFSKNSSSIIAAWGGFAKTNNFKITLPEHFKFSIDLGNLQGWYSSEIVDDVDELIFHFFDDRIQSFVWILQNMTYNVNRTFSKYEHIISYPIYDCKFNSVKVKIVNTQKIRDKKIDLILYGN